MSDVVSNAHMPALATRGQPTALGDWARDTLMLAVGVQVALLIPSLISYLFDERTLNGISVWSKPIKFEISLIITIGTIIWLLPLIAEQARRGRVARWTAVLLGLMTTGEISYLVIQAARGRASHFNTSTQLEATLYNAMGVGAVLIVASCFVFGLMIWRRGVQSAPKGLRYGGAVGLMLGAVLTLITAGIMGSGELAANSHWIGGVRSDAGGLFLVGWSRTGGDLRVPHFFATHMMQGLPILGLLLDRLAPRFVRSGLWLGATLGVVIVVGTFAQAVAGRPFL